MLRIESLLRDVPFRTGFNSCETKNIPHRGAIGKVRGFARVTLACAARLWLLNATGDV